MNRCKSFFPALLWRRQLLLAALALPLCAAWSSSLAQTLVRNFPPQAERGLMVVTYPPIIQMDGKPDRLSPGSRIRGSNNMLVLSGTLVGQNLLVNYVRTPTGEVHDVWILTEAEAALKLPTQR